MGLGKQRVSTAGSQEEDTAGHRRERAPDEKGDSQALHLSTWGRGVNGFLDGNGRPQ